MKKFLFVLLTLILIFSAVSVSASAINFKDAPGKTAVDIRVIVHKNYVSRSYELTLHIVKLSGPNGEELDDDYTTVTRPYYETTIYLDPGYYQIVSVGGSGDLVWDYYGNSDVFEAKGEKMVVYCPLQNNENPVVMPDHPVVYGEDTQTWQRWVITAPSDDENSEEYSEEEKESENIKEITDVDYTAYTAEESLSDTVAYVSETETLFNNENNPASAKITPYVIFGILIAVILGGGIGYFIIKHKREEI